MMKKLLFTFILISFFSINVNSQIRIVKVDPDNNKITLKNFGSSTVDITGNRLCAKFSYLNISTSVIDTGNLNLAQNEEVILNWTIDATGSDLGYYTASGSFGSAANMLDFTQWGTGGNGRESVAVAKGIWDTGAFITSGSPYFYNGNGIENGLSHWQNSLSTLQFETLINFSMYPNPASTELHLDFPNLIDETTIEVYDILGKRILTKTANNLTNTLNIANWNNGMYLLKISTNDGKSLTKRFVKI